MGLLDAHEREALLISRCEECGLYRNCRSPKMPPTGKGKRKILVVAESPGEEEDKRGIQLIGPSGQLLRKVLSECDVDLEEDCWKTNAIICKPGQSGSNTKTIPYCRPNLLRAVRELQPTVILLLGGIAVESLIGYLWGGDTGGITRWAGWQIPDQTLNAWICPAYHPAYLLRANDPVLELWFRRHIQAAVSLTDRPWSKPPRFADSALAFSSPSAAADWLSDLPPGPICFDYETTTLKPETGGAAVLSCAVHHVTEGTRAFPWQGPVLKQMSRLLQDGQPKVGCNIKFEERWTRAVLGHGIKRWSWDTILAAHVLDNRSGITSLKFQAYVLLGQPRWDREVSDYISAQGAVNRLREIDFARLLQYNAMDARLTWEVAKIQRRKLSNHEATAELRRGVPAVA